MNNQKLYGIVEGFFSTPLPMWTHQERLHTLDVLKRYCPYINTYLYCPKDDPFITQQWDILYPIDTIKELQETIDHCQVQGINFCFGLNPAFNRCLIEKDKSYYIDTIVKKLKQLQQIGVQQFCILFDDIPYAYDVSARLRQQEDKSIAIFQAEVINTCQQLIATHDQPIWLCGSDYFFQQKNQYIVTLNRHLNPIIPLIWTGSDIFTQKINHTSIQQARDVVGGRSLLWWDNYPVNDCEHSIGTFHIGAFNNPDLDTLDHLDGIFINPMRESAANWIAYYTFNDFLKDKKNYNRSVSFRGALQKIFPNQAHAIERVYQSWSALNIVDQQPRGYYQALLQAESVTTAKVILNDMEQDLLQISSTDQFSTDGQLFLQTTAAVIQKADAVLQCSRSILNQSMTWKVLFEFIDALPVTHSKSYLPRLYKILCSRVDYTVFLLGRQDTLMNVYSLLDDLHQLVIKYPGRLRLEMSRTDEAHMLAIVEHITQRDRVVFLTSIQSHSPIDKIHAILRRSSISLYNNNPLTID